MPLVQLKSKGAVCSGTKCVEMQDSETGVRLGHATMDVRYHAGGYDAQTVLPGQTITMLMEFQGSDTKEHKKINLKTSK